MTDRELIAGCIKDSREHQEILFKKYAPRLKFVCVRYTNSNDEAEKMLIESFYVIFSTIRKLKSEQSLERWLRDVTIKECLKGVKKVKFQDLHPQNFQDSSLETLTTNELILCLQKLPIEHRIVYNMYAVDSYSPEEIAREVGATTDLIKAKLEESRKQLQEHINTLTHEIH